MKYIKIYELLDCDGGDGRSNKLNGFLTRNKAVADEWSKQGIGNDYTVTKGVLIESLSEMKDARRELDRQKALDKLNVKDKEILGLSDQESSDGLSIS